MILRRLSIFCFLLMVSAQDFDCHLTVDSLKYDLTSLAGEHTISRTRHTPPTDMLDELKFDVCAELKSQDGVAEADQCPAGTRACLTKTNKKSDNSDRIVAVIPLAQTSSLNARYSALSAPMKGLSLVFHGASYPPDDPKEQSLNFTLLCDTESSTPVFSSYDGAQLHVEWKTPAGCPFAGDEPPKQDEEEKEKPTESVGSGIGWFFLVLLLAFAAYFGLGAYYNYSTYGARGADLIPHRDFWKEVPYMFSDVLSHLCSTVRPRKVSSRGGYIAV